MQSARESLVVIRSPLPVGAFSAVCSGGIFRHPAELARGRFLGHQGRQQGGVWIGVRIGLLFGRLDAISSCGAFQATGLTYQPFFTSLYLTQTLYLTPTCGPKVDIYCRLAFTFAGVDGDY